MNKAPHAQSVRGEDGRVLVLRAEGGSLLWSEADAASDRPVLGAVLGERSCLMVDAGASPAHGRAFLRALEAATGRRPELVALTHWHWDHSFGLAGLGLPAAAHRRTLERLAGLRGLSWDDAALAERVARGEEIEFCAKMIAAEYGEARDIEIALPERVFEESLELDLGGLSARLLHLEADHTDDAVVVLIPELRTAFLGDILGAAYYERPVRYRPARFIALVEAILALPADTFIEGHDEPIGRSRLGYELSAHLAVARALLGGEADRRALVRIAEDALPEEAPAELHRLVAFMMRGMEEAPDQGPGAR